MLKKSSSEVITRLAEIDGSAVGVIAAQEIIDIVTLNFGPEIYNKALRDSKEVLLEKLSDIYYELDQLGQR